jgi:signal transduction histidine kinase
MPFFLIILLGVSAFAQQNALILNSYNPTFTWTDEVTKGIRDVLIENNNLNIHLEYMDVLTEKHEQGFYIMLNNKYADVKFDVVITVDYTAFNFAKNYRDKLWKNVPMVSCGISKEQAESVYSDTSLWAGIYEFYDVPAQIDFIHRTMPNVKKIIFITDNTEGGQSISEQLGQTSVINQRSIDMEEWKEPAWENIPKLFSNLNPRRDAVVLANKKLKNSINPQRLWQETTKYVSDSSKAPIYTFWNIGVQNGVVGGNVIFAPLMGKNIGLLAAGILAETENYNFDFQKNANIPIIDEHAAIAKDLSFDKLPPETIRLNKVDTWLNKYQQYMSNLENAIIAAIVVILILASAFYAYFRYSNKKLLREMFVVARASKAKSLFLANMSHEIRTPLNSMLGFSELLLNKSKNLSEEQKEWCKSIKISTYHLRDTLNNILDYSKMETENLKIEEEWVDIFSLCDDLISVSQHYLFYKNIRFYVMPSITLPRYVKTDSVRLKQVLMNLINNALKFTNIGSVTLTINYIQEQNEHKIHFEVVDTGIGIPKEKIKKIFYAFEQADMGNSRKYGGSGLGLAISKNILLAMGSNLEVQSEEKKGSRFYFNLPAKTREEAFYKRYLHRENQKVAIYHQDPKVVKYICECVVTIKGFAVQSHDIREILNFNDQDLLIAEADRLTDFQLQSISNQFPRVILLFYKESERISLIKRDFPKFECILTPVKSKEAISALSRLYATNA